MGRTAREEWKDGDRKRMGRCDNGGPREEAVMRE